ncbi:molybdenum ABC transporter ATP-binding protein [uncultured Roseobacter sp.]|uniref:molybdenum ABC transporter ATP-binding protein n=1 Tax=uncultured Roseobacter sp. TaxID=114847 RepID=UPI00262B40D4|nr:molybdenum ABC transporter ATP-binding protein [uncultured Roseobacter sp.]
MTLAVSVQHKLSGFDLDVTFEAPPGITVLFGRSGAGKTTIVNAVAGLLKPDGGRVAADDLVLFDIENDLWLPPHKRRLGYVFQDARLFPHLSVRQNLLYGRWFAPGTEPRGSFDQIIEMLGIEDLLKRRPAALSGGEKQRVAIGRALLANPKLILADEPLSSLDDARKSDILPYFERLRDETKIPILYVSHAATEVARIATSVVALEKGRVTRQGPAADVLSDLSVAPLGVRATGSMIEAVVKSHHSDGLSALATEGTQLLVPRVDHPIGTKLRVWIGAQDVMVATSRPNGISALNVLEVEIKELRLGSGPGVMVQLSFGASLLLARITRRSADALALEPGQTVYAVIKAVSVPRDAIGDAPSPR